MAHAGTDTDSWMLHGDNHTPDEVIDMTGKTTGGELNFPKGLMGPEICKKLHAMKPVSYKLTSQIIGDAGSLTKPQFESKFHSVWGTRVGGAYSYFRRLFDNGVYKGR
jgi:hypothetical protein